MGSDKISVVYMVAGMSSRFQGKIKQFCKVGLNDETLIEYSADEAIRAGFNEIIFIVGEKTERPFKELFGEEYKGVPVKYAKQTFNNDERDKPWGTVDALISAKPLIENNFVVCNGDDIYGYNTFKIVHEHLSNKDECVTIGFKLGNVLPETGTVNRGIFQVENEYVKSIIETFNISKENLKENNLTLNSLCSMNIFGLTKEVLEDLALVLTNFKEQNKGNRTVECLLPVELGKLLEKRDMKIFSTPDTWLGVTNPGDDLIVKEQIKKIHEAE